MSLILHLSDLHLGSPSEWQFDYTDKFGLDRAAGDTKLDHLRLTLRALAETLRREDRILDALVVSGDVTNANRDDGYQDFGQLLGELGDRLPAPGRTIVVPGNHDADWTLQPGRPAKFRRFLDAVRASHRTPLINGLDYDADSLDRRTGSRTRAQPILELDDTAIVALSSADYSGVEEQRTTTPWRKVIASFAAGDTSLEAQDARALATRELRELRVYDMARIDKRQLEALAGRMDTTSLARSADEDVRVRIAVLHHPISPVTDREEIKAFETLTNLEKVRSFFFDKEFHIVLHGHKHASYLGWDWLLPPGEDLTATPWRTLVIGSPGDFLPGQTVCRLIETCPDGDEPVAGAPRVRIIDVPGARPGQRLSVDFTAQCLSLAQPFVRSADTTAPWIVRAQTADAAYQQLRDLPRDPSIPRAVITVVEDATSAAKLPKNYPEPNDDVWLENVVKWWQHPAPQAVGAIFGSHFNHGQRLYGDKDAIGDAAAALPSSKAIALLVHREEAGNPDLEFPALTAVQLQSRRNNAGGTFLDAVGIYRKQDLQLWWPVNLCELAYIQEYALPAAQENPNLLQPVVRGRLIAVASIGIHDTVLPQMAGTVLDRAVDLRPDWPLRLAYLAARPRRATKAEWTEALSDVGTREGDDVAVPSVGLSRLGDALAMHRELGGDGARLEPIIESVERLAADAQVAADRLTLHPTPQARVFWSNRLRDDADSVLVEVRRRVEAAGRVWN